MFHTYKTLEIKYLSAQSETLKYEKYQLRNNKLQFIEEKCATAVLRNACFLARAA